MTQFEHTGTMRDTARLYWQANRRYKLLSSLAFLNTIAALFMTVLLPFFASKILAGIVQDDPNLSDYLWLFAASATVGLTIGRIGFVSNMRMQARVMSDLNHKMFEHLLQRSTGFHANRISGKLVSDALDFVASYSQLTSIILTSVLPFTVTIITGLILVFVSSWKMGVFVTFIVAVILTWAILNSKRRSRLRAKRLVATTDSPSVG